MHHTRIVSQQIARKHRGHDPSIELAARMFTKLFNHDGEGERPSVWAVGRRGLYRVTNADDLGACGNLRPNQSIGIALTILPLVVMTHREYHILRHGGKVTK